MTFINFAGSTSADRTTTIRPSSVLVFYTGSKVVTQHDIKESADGKNYISSGTQLTKEGISNIYGAMTGVKKSGFKIMSPNILHCDSEHIVWTTKQQVRPMWFLYNGKRVVINKAPYPALLWSIRKSKGLKVGALKSNGRPTEKTKVYHAPLMNINQQGRLCQGTARLPKLIDIGCIGEYEATVFDSNFSHTNFSRTFKLGSAKDEVSNRQHIDQWRELDGKDKFPSAKLVSTKLNIEEWING